MTGSPLYDVSPEHVLGLLFILLVPLGAWMVRRSTSARAWLDGYRRLPAIHRLLVWLLLVSAAIHAGLALGHDEGRMWILFLADTILLGWAAWRLVAGARWRLVAGVVLLGSILAYFPAVLGEGPDQVGLATKLVELTALAIVIRPRAGARWRGVAASGAIVALVVATATLSWIGAFALAGEGGGDDHDAGTATGHHHHEAGSVAAPGSVMTPIAGRDPTAAESAAAERLHAEAVAAIARYADPALAAADGYNVDGIAGVDFHAMNPAYEQDGRVLDPVRPEALVYGMSPRGPVLLGAMFVMPRIDQPGPAVGGPLTMWHAHEKICFSLLPPALTGIESPLGWCPVGSLDLPTTGQMIHIWTATGAPEPFGDLAEPWRRSFVAGWHP